MTRRWMSRTITAIVAVTSIGCGSIPRIYISDGKSIKLAQSDEMLVWAGYTFDLICLGADDNGVKSATIWLSGKELVCWNTPGLSSISSQETHNAQPGAQVIGVAASLTCSPNVDVTFGLVNVSCEVRSASAMRLQ